MAILEDGSSLEKFSREKAVSDVLLEEWDSQYLIPQDKLEEFKRDVDNIYMEDYDKLFYILSEKFDKKWDKYKFTRVLDE